MSDNQCSIDIDSTRTEITVIQYCWQKFVCDVND